MSSACLSPKETSDALIRTAVKKASYSTEKRLLLSFMAGVYIALGAQGFLVAYGNPFIRAAVFPVGLMLIVLVGGELFTGNCLMTLGLMQKEITFKDYLKTLVQVFLGNFLGSLFIVALLYFVGVYNKPEMAETIITVAKAKTSLSFVQVLNKGIMCNILVALGVWFATTAKDTTGKLLGCWFPVMLFVLCGYEHVVANMFFLPMGAILNSSITITQIISNLIPATIGNFIGGGLVIPMIYNKIYYT
ncbi:formate/nitrite transporter family protein [Sedimentibacter sp.]|uniref:formate/nitrite transporter family protein n=1 Tax=Sedimentibacter sp. TaxID=1960295 RepID=UPI0028B0C587|nr:formate/nitrite transporter family protein [Sedimentibacter sp.]